MQLVLAARPDSRCATVPQLFASGRFIGGCSDALVLHAQGRLEPTLREAAADCTRIEVRRDGGEKQLRATAAAASGVWQLARFPMTSKVMESEGRQRGQDGECHEERPMLHRSLSG